MIQRPYFETIAKRIEEPRKFIQIIEGPRQVGKSTLGLHTFQDLFHPYRSVLVGEEGIPIETFLKSDLKELFA